MSPSITMLLADVFLSPFESLPLSLSQIAHWGRVDILYNNAAPTVLCNEKDRAVHELVRSRRKGEDKGRKRKGEKRRR
jgi:hypothetical protein